MTSSAAVGKQSRQRSLIRHQLDVPSRSTSTKRDIAEDLEVVRDGGLADVDGLDDLGDRHRAPGVASRFRIRIRVGSPSARNQVAHVAASSRSDIHR